MPEQSSTGDNVGKIVEIKGVVIDAVFPDELPPINNAITVGKSADVIVAVLGESRDLSGEAASRSSLDRP